MPALIVTDLGFGDSGKGTMVDYLVRSYGADGVVRYNGGAQAAHNVIALDGRHHTFAQFGAGTFVPGVKTHLSKHMLVNPLNLFAEAEHLHSLGISDVFDRLSIDADAPITTPFHVAVNRLKERTRGTNRHGSCGLGIGETVEDMLRGYVLRARDLLRPQHEIMDLMSELQERKRAEASELRLVAGPEWDWLRSRAVVTDTAITYEIVPSLVRITEDFQYEGILIFEGAQGVLLDQDYGFHPHTTWSKTTTENADDLLDGYNDEICKIGVLRSYATRHGAGPFVTEDSLLGRVLVDQHNGQGDWQGNFRVGWTDLVMARYALAVDDSIDVLAITHMDRTNLTPWKICSAYRMLGEITPDVTIFDPGDKERRTRQTERLMFDADPIYCEAAGEDVPEIFEEALGIPVAFTSHGSTADDKKTMLAIA